MSEKPLTDKVTNVVMAGLGGQGVVKASDILADAAFRAGLDVKKAEIHGMSQRGGSVSTDVRFGKQVLSPMVPAGEADFLLVLSADQVDNNLQALKKDGVLIRPEMVDEGSLASKKSLNIALLGILSAKLDLPASAWKEALSAALPAKGLEANLQAFELGRRLAEKCH
jgi:indolepyruvate ferredoxin oxidoreductase, beta subunit